MFVDWLPSRATFAISILGSIKLEWQLTLHCHSYSSVVGGTTFFFVSSLAGSSSDANLRGGGWAPRFCTAGIFFFSHRSFRVNRGPISCNAAFSVERKAYLRTYQHWRETMLGSRTYDAGKTRSLADYARWRLAVPQILVGVEREFGTSFQRRGLTWLQIHSEWAQDCEESLLHDPREMLELYSWC